MTIRLQMITFVVPDYDPAISFFADGLGFDLISNEDQGRKRWVVVGAPGGGSRMVLARASDEAQERAIGCQTGGRVGFFLQTDTFDDTAQRITRSGGHFTEEPRNEPYGRVAVFRDPWGNLWDLIEPAGKN